MCSTKFCYSKVHLAGREDYCYLLNYKRKSSTFFSWHHHTQISACNRVYFIIISRPIYLKKKKKNECYTCKWEMGASLMAQMVKNLPAMQEAWVQFLGQEDHLEKGMATHSSILAWRIPWTEEPGGLQSMEVQRVRHDLVTALLPLLSGRWVTFIWPYLWFINKI